MKLTRLFLAAAMMLFAACEKNQGPQPEGGLKTISAKTSEVRTTTTDGVNVKWESGDEIALFVSGGGTDADQASALYTTDVNPPATTATFTLVNENEPVKQGDNYIAIYPSSQLYKWKSTGKKACTMDLVSEQTVSAAGWDKRASLMAASSTTNDFVFNHCVAYLKFTIDAESPSIVSFAASTATDGELIAARVEVNIADDNTVTVTETTPVSLQKETATLSTGNGEAFPAGTYYLAILPKTYSDGFVLEFTDVNGKVIERRVEGEVAMQAGWVGNIGTVRKLTGSTAEPLKPYDLFGGQVRVSIIGDSISTFAGTMPTSEFKTYYPKLDEATGEYYDVQSVSDLYWAKVAAQMTNAIIDVNNSWSGSMVSRRPEADYNGKDYGARVSLYGLGKPDVILIYGGTNDCTKFSAAHKLYPGEYRSNLFEGEAYKGMTATLPTDEMFAEVFATAEAAEAAAIAAGNADPIEALKDSCSFTHAYVKLITKVHYLYPDAKVVMIIGDQFTKRAKQVIDKITEHYGQPESYGYKSVDFFGDGANIEKIKEGNAHPSAAGHTYMANKIYTEVGDYIDIQKQ